MNEPAAAWPRERGRPPGRMSRQVSHGEEASSALHMAHDSLVGWGWRPGGLREPAPGTQAQFGALIAAWIESGAACPR